MTDTVRESLELALGAGYSLGRELGGGAMSRVWTAHDESLGRDVVVKLLSPDLAPELSVERFTREVRLAAHLQHAHIVPLLTAGVTTNGRPYYLMPFVDGESLRARLDRPESTHGLPIDDVVSILRDVCRALAYAHARGVVHRDIKPDNVLISGGAAVVADFGIAKAMRTASETGDATNSTLTRVGTAIGSPTYMSPEQGSGDPSTDHRTDIYALGVTAYELLTGSPPFVQRSTHALLLAHFTEPPVDVRTRRAEVPDRLATLVMSCLEKNPDDRPQSADALATLLGASLIRHDGTSERPRTATPRATPSRRLWPGGVLTAIVLALCFGAFRYFKKPSDLDADLIAVMPFTVRDSGMLLWREGLVDLLSRSLDGAGSLRTVAASTSISQSPARADAASAATLGTSVGAGLVLFGDVSPSGRDSVHLRFALYDVGAARTRYNFDLRGETSRMDALADSIALRVLRELGGAGRTGGAPLSSVGTRSLAAMRAFLQGQQYYRRGALDSARTAYTRALESDSAFALAWRGVASVFIREGREDDAEAIRALDMAIRYKGGRSPRDSMLLRADSLRLEYRRRTPGAIDALDPISVLPLLFSTLQRATASYPSDAELWFELGDAAFHFGALAGVPSRDAATWFERGTALDSTFVVPYFHLFQLAMRDGRTSDAGTHAERIARLQSGGATARWYGMLGSILRTSTVTDSSRRLLDSLPSPYAAALVHMLALIPDSAAIGLHVVRTLLRTPLRNGRADPDSTRLRDEMAFAFAARGLGTDALRLSRDLPMLVQLERIGLYPADSMTPRAREWLRVDPSEAIAAGRFFAAQRDTASLTRLVTWADSVDRAAAVAKSGDSTGYTAILHAYRTLVGGDSSRALRALLALPMTECRGIPCAGSMIATLLIAAGRPADAAMVYDRWLPVASDRIDFPLDWLARARLAEESNDAELAATLYRRVVTMWNDGDAGVQGAVREAANGLQRLSRR